jgi:serine/threonine protein kinase
MPLSSGARLGPYETEAAIEAGGIGEVYKARDTRLDRTVAIKILPAELSADSDRRTRLEREARAIAAHRHAIIHRDLRPGNVVPTSGGAGRSGVTSATLPDFGSAMLTSHAERPALVSETHAVTEAAPVTARETILRALP